jgi:hypothetical protein
MGLKGMDFYLERPEDYDFTMACYVLGTIYKDLKKTEEAEKLYKLAIQSKHDPNTWDARVYTGCPTF